MIVIDYQSQLAKFERVLGENYLLLMNANYLIKDRFKDKLLLDSKQIEQ